MHRTPTILVLVATFLIGSQSTAQSQSGAVLIDVERQLSGMVSHTGENTYFRLYADGTVEFETDDPESKGPDYASLRAVRCTLPPSALSKFQTLLAAGEAASFEAVYNLGSGLDHAECLVMRFPESRTMRGITVNNFFLYRGGTQASHGEFPRTLARLLEMMQAVREGQSGCLNDDAERPVAAERAQR